MRTLLLLVFLVTATMAFSQTEGVVTYKDVADIHKQLPPDRQQYKDMIPQFRTAHYELHYKEKESMYLASKTEDIPQEASQGRRWGAQRPQRDVYKNLEENRLVDSREFMTKKFLIRGELDETTWKIADGQKQILDYMCLKAVYQDTADTYVAWFTPQIPISNGPAEYGGLPGMIMEIDKNDQEQVITAVEVVSGEVSSDLLAEPKKGKEVTSEEFREIVREKMMEMRAQRKEGQ